MKILTNASLRWSLWVTYIAVFFLGVAGLMWPARLQIGFVLAEPLLPQLAQENCAGPPVISQQPAPQSVPEGIVALFSVQASSSTNSFQCPTRFQWQRRNSGGTNFESIPGANSRFLVLVAGDEDRNASFRVIVSNAAGSVTSRAADLMVTGGDCAAPPVITRQPRSQAGTEGVRVTFSVRASSSTRCPTHYQWARRNTGDDGFELLPGANSPDLVWTPTIEDTQGAAFRVTVSNAAGSVTSEFAELNVRNNCAGPPIITRQPTAQTAPEGAQVTLSLRATSSPQCETRIQWQRRGLGDEDFTNLGLDAPPRDLIWTVTPEDRGALFRALVLNQSGAILSDEVELRVGTLECLLASPNGSFQNKPFSPQNGTFIAEFDATPSAAPINSTIGLSNGPQTAHTGFAAIARFNSSGNIDARNGGTYTAANTIPYSAGVRYHFRLVVNVSAHTYSIFVTPEGGAELTVGNNFAFRAEQNTVASLNSFGVWTSATPVGSNNVCSFATSSGVGNTFLFIEAESGLLSAPMQVFSDPNASAGQYIAVASGNNSLASPPSNGVVYYPFTITTAGAYRVLGRVIAPTDSDDSFWIRMDDGNWIKWNEIAQGADWHWDELHNADRANAVVTFNLSATTHTLAVAYREDGTRLDRLLITNDRIFVPTGVGQR